MVDTLEDSQSIAAIEESKLLDYITGKPVEDDFSPWLKPGVSW